MRHGTLLLLLLLTACPGTREQAILLPDEGAGQLRVTTPRATQVLVTPYATAAVRPDGRVQAGTTTPEAVAQRYGDVLATLPESGRLFVLYFDTGTVRLTAESQAEVPALLAEVARRLAVEVEITGHTDQTGTDAANERLSLARAEAVHQLLVAQGLAATFVRAIGRGSRVPRVARPGTAEGTNRRVEVLIR